MAPVCTYSVGDPFSDESGAGSHACGRPAIKRADFPPKPHGFGPINYCKRHWNIASQVILPGVIVEDLDADPE